jgi:hypothetical protein
MEQTEDSVGRSTAGFKNGPSASGRRIPAIRPKRDRFAIRETDLIPALRMTG